MQFHWKGSDEDQTRWKTFSGEDGIYVWIKSLGRLKTIFNVNNLSMIGYLTAHCFPSSLVLAFHWLVGFIQPPTERQFRALISRQIRSSFSYHVSAPPSGPFSRYDRNVSFPRHPASGAMQAFPPRKTISPVPGKLFRFPHHQSKTCSNTAQIFSQWRYSRTKWHWIRSQIQSRSWQQCFGVDIASIEIGSIAQIARPSIPRWQNEHLGPALLDLFGGFGIRLRARIPLGTSFVGTSPVQITLGSSWRSGESGQTSDSVEMASFSRGSFASLEGMHQFGYLWGYDSSDQPDDITLGFPGHWSFSKPWLSHERYCPLALYGSKLRGRQWPLHTKRRKYRTSRLTPIFSHKYKGIFTNASLGEPREKQEVGEPCHRHDVVFPTHFQQRVLPMDQVSLTTFMNFRE